MASYILRRLALMLPTLFGILLISFVIIQFVPGGPVERMIAQLQGHGTEATARFGGGSGGDMAGSMQSAVGQSSKYRGGQGLDPEFIKELEALYGFDKPAPERFWIMLKNYVRFDLGQSYYRDVDVTGLILEKMPVSISLGLWSTLIIYLVSIPLGIKKAVRDGSGFDFWTSAAVFFGYSIPAFMFAILLIVIFAGGRYLDWFPLRGLVSDNWQDMNFHSPRQRPLGKAGALPPCLPQRHADRHRRLPGGLHPYFLHGSAADRGDFLAGWTRPARI
jgi:microcin C transport system permease protein